MKADKNNFRFRNDGSDEAKMAIWTISPHLDGSSLWYGIVNGIKDFWGSLYYEKYEHLPLVTPAEAIRLMQGEDIEQKWEPKWGDEVEGDIAAPFDLITKTGKYIGKHPNNEIEHLIGCGYKVFRAINIRPIPPKPVTAEEELSDILAGVTFEDTRHNTVERIMDWYIRHTIKEAEQKPLEVTDEEIRRYLDSNWKLDTTIDEITIQTVRHFMELQRKGGKG